ncbi:MAG: hypothetical protein ABII23_06735 [bacterium]
MSNVNRVGIFLIILGVLFGLETYFNLKILSNLWPLILTSIGSGFIAIFYKREKREAIYLGIGIYIICFSLLALYCNFTSWENIGSLWPLFLGFAGISFFITYIFYRRVKLYLFIATSLFSITAIFFLVFSVSNNYWWLILIFLGISILMVGKK